MELPEFKINFTHKPWIIENYKEIVERFNNLLEPSIAFKINFTFDNEIKQAKLYDATISITEFAIIINLLGTHYKLFKFMEDPEKDISNGLTLKDFYQQSTYSSFFKNEKYPLYGMKFSSQYNLSNFEQAFNRYPNGFLVKTDHDLKLLTKDKFDNNGNINPEFLGLPEFIGYGSGEGQSYTGEFHTGEEEDITKLPPKRWNPPAIIGLIAVCLIAILGTLFLGYLAGILIFYVIWRRKSGLRRPFLWALIWPIRLILNSI